MIYLQGSTVSCTRVPDAGGGSWGADSGVRVAENAPRRLLAPALGLGSRVSGLGACGEVSARRGAPAAARHDSTPGERRCTQILPLPPRR